MTDENAILLRTRLDAAIQLLKGARALAEGDDGLDDAANQYCVQASIKAALLVIEYALNLLPENDNDH